MNWETGEEDGSGWTGLAPSRDPEEKAFDDGVRSVITIRCMDHRDAPQINNAGHGECGECIRQQCWKDILGLIAAAIEDAGALEGELLVILEKTMLENGMGTFGVADELEAEHNSSQLARGLGMGTRPATRFGAQLLKERVATCQRRSK